MAVQLRYLCNRLTDFDITEHGDASVNSAESCFYFCKSNMAERICATKPSVKLARPFGRRDTQLLHSMTSGRHSLSLSASNCRLKKEKKQQHPAGLPCSLADNGASADSAPDTPCTRDSFSVGARRRPGHGATSTTQ